MALRQSRVSTIGVKNVTAGLATKVVGQGLVNRCTDRRTSSTACCTAKQDAEDRASDGTQRMNGVLLNASISSPDDGGRSTLDSTSDATNGSSRRLGTPPSDDERGVATWTRYSHVRATPCGGATALLLRLPLANRKPIKKTMANATRLSSTG
jgi:hypothetical protein